MDYHCHFRCNFHVHFHLLIRFKYSSSYYFSASSSSPSSADKKFLESNNEPKTRNFSQPNGNVDFAHHDRSWSRVVVPDNTTRITQTKNLVHNTEIQEDNTVRLTVYDLVPLHAQRRVRGRRHLRRPWCRRCHLQGAVGALPTGITEALVRIGANLFAKQIVHRSWVNHRLR